MMEGLNQNERIVWSCWETKTPREVVREAASKGTHLNLAYKYLETKLNWDKSTAVEWFTSEVFAWIVQLLSRKQYFKASHVLKKINVRAEDHILNVARESKDTELRNYITDQLLLHAEDLKKDKPKEWEAYLEDWNLFNLLQKSFNFKGVPKQNNVFGFGKDMIVITCSDMTSYTIEILAKFPLDWKKKVAAHLFLDSFDFSVLHYLDPEFIWKILLEKNMVILLRRWIALSNYKEKYIQYDNSMIDKNALKVDTLLLDSQETLQKLDDLLMRWPITASMIEIVLDCKCFSFTKMCVFDAMCAFGYVIESEKNDLKAILRRLSRTQNLYNIDKIFSKHDNAFKNHLNNMLAEFSIESNNFHAMSSCVDVDLLKKDISELKKNGTKNFIDLWLLFKAVQDSKDVSTYVHAVYETCKYLSKSNMPQYLSENHLILLGILLFSDSELFNVFTDDKSLTIDNINLNWEESPISSLPHLHSVYQRWKTDSLIIVNDITVYQLLSGYQGLDISKIFEFQFSAKNKKSINSSSNTKQKKTSNYVDEFPHCENMNLMKKYAYDKKLNYLYYLRQNRPCMASQALLVQQYQAFRRLNVSMLRDACMQAHTLALKNWNNNVITSSCISFITMIGCDAMRCRTHISCAQMLAEHFENVEKLSRDDVNRKVEGLVAQLIENKPCFFFDISKTLEDIYLSRDNRFVDCSTIDDFGDMLYEWQTIVKFAYFHKLPLPISPLKHFAEKNLWLPFFIFADVFKYSLHDMLRLSREFSDPALAQHVTQCIKNQIVRQAVLDNQPSNLRHHKNSNENINEDESPESDGYIDFENVSDDLWEVMTICHGPEDPPAALIKASAAFHCPILALLATCYEPDAVDLCWTQWLITSIKKNEFDVVFSSETDASEIVLNDEKIHEIIKVCAETGYYKTLHESFVIFFKESPLCILLQFIVRTVYELNFDEDSMELLRLYKISYNKHSANIHSGEGLWLPRFVRPKYIDSIAHDLVTIVLCKSFNSSWHQRKFLQCLCEAKLFKDPINNFCTLTTMLDISMEVDIKIDLEEICGSNAENVITSYVNLLINEKLFGAATRFASAANLPKEDISIAEWVDKYRIFMNENEDIDCNDFAVLQFWTKCSNGIKNDKVPPKKSVLFLKEYCDKSTSKIQRFYFLRLLLSWFEDVEEDVWPDWNICRDEIEYEMWTTYLSCEEISKLHLLSIQGTYDYILNFNLESFGNNCDFQEISTPPTNQKFKLLLREIVEYSNITNMSIVTKDLNELQTEKLIHCIESLLNMGLICEAWRLNNMFNASAGFAYFYNPIDLVEICLKMVEGYITPNELPATIQNLITPSVGRNFSSGFDTVYKDFVLISGKREELPEDVSQLPGRVDADILSILDFLAAKTGYNVIKQISDYFKIAVQINWEYQNILKFDGNPLELITNLSGRSRMPLAKIVFRAFEIPSQEIMEYICLEIVTAIISCHLVRTTGFNQKEHFQYTVWGYPLDSDFEMFLNMRPEDNSILGRMLLEHLSAFRKSYKIRALVVLDDKGDENIDDERLDEILNEEYQNIDDDEVESLCSENTINMDSPNHETFYKTINKALALDNQSVGSTSTVTYNSSRKLLRDRKPQLDVISCTNMKISPVVKSNVKSILKNTKLSSKQINIISIELLVLAHECFSSVCDTEGIATALRSAQTLANQLLSTRSWRLLVRLLTGMARYTEMAYIFQMLKDNDQFEFLLGQFNYMLGSQEEKISNFKLGLLEFLRRHCPSDTDTYCLVALHFSMYSEAAEVKRKQADDLIVTVKQMALDAMKILRKRLTPQPKWIILEKNESTCLLLDTALNHSCDAAEFFAKGDCLGAAREMAGLAQLIALQISLLSKKPPAYCILKISTENMVAAINKHLSFMEGLIYAHASDAFEGGWVTRWKEIVYQKVVKAKDVNFVNDIEEFRPDIAVYIIERYDEEKNPNKPDDILITQLRSLFK